ncbi:MAG: hypothetical protein KGJ60_01155 [Verrucomicrobiota bacterium]|nr:hypothetical protein [Verrucomicrobiota bacterium]
MKINNREKLLIAVTLSVIALFFADRLVFEPLAGWWKTRQAQIAELRRQVHDGALLLQREAGLRSHWDSMRTNTLPANTSLAEQQVLGAFDRWSRDSGVSVTGITPQWNTEATNYMTLACRVEASGDLGAVSRFLYDIEKDPMALKLDTLDLNAHDGTGQQFTLDLQVSRLALKSAAP